MTQPMRVAKKRPPMFLSPAFNRAGLVEFDQQRTLLQNPFHAIQNPHLLEVAYSVTFEKGKPAVVTRYARIMSDSDSKWFTTEVTAREGTTKKQLIGALATWAADARKETGKEGVFKQDILPGAHEVNENGLVPKV